MNGAEALVRTAADLGVDVCFANPGTTELPLVSALDGEPRIRPVLTLFEGVATGAADGFARLAGRPALTLTHLGPGFANGAACLHNARRSRTPVVNLVGDHATWHLPYDPPLASDIAGLAGPVSVWLRQAGSAAALPGDLAEACAAATARRGPATLVVPADVQWDDAGSTPGRVLTPERAEKSAAARGADDALAAAVKALTSGRPGGLLLGGTATTAAGLRAAERIAASTGCAVALEKFPTRVERGRGLPAFSKLGYFPEAAAAALPADGELVLAGAREPAAFFGYPGLPSSEVPPGTSVTTLTDDGSDGGTDSGPDGGPDGGPDTAELLTQLADLLDRPGASEAAGHAGLPVPVAPARPSGRLDVAALAAAVAATQPEGAIVTDEGVTSTREYLDTAAGAAPHTYLANAGGAIGHGLPLATGAAVAAPDRPVVALQADGSGMYTVQSLWTQAREGLDVTTVICANQSYRILQAEMMRGGTAPGQAAAGLTDLGRPALDWVALAGGMGVPGRLATTAEELVAALEAAFAEPGPHLVEARLAD